MGFALVLMIQAATAVAPTPATDPLTWVGFADYPPAAIRANEQGTVKVRLAIDTQGRPVSCRIVASSGYQSLDQATCTTLSSRARFRPGEAGRVFERAVKWKLPNSEMPGVPIDVAHTSVSGSAVEVELSVGYDGRVENCRVVEAFNGGNNNACDATPPGTSMGTRYVRDGKPIKALVHQRTNISTTFP